MAAQVPTFSREWSLVGTLGDERVRRLISVVHEMPRLRQNAHRTHHTLDRRPQSSLKLVGGLQ
ncbi:MAG: hypothetical protein AAGC80_20510 [Rhodococcus sp. (in: high G+C Gram-positive bacteria)]